jgi:hypothetical protein
MIAALPSAPLCGAPDCAQPAGDGSVCWSCIGELRGALRSLPELLGELLITVCRQDAVAPQGVGGGGSDEPPLLYRPEASEAGRDLHFVLETWTAHAMRARGLDITEIRRASRPDIRQVEIGPVRPPVPGQRTVPERYRTDTRSGRFPDNDTIELALWLDRHLETVRMMPSGGQLCDEIVDACARVERATDRAAQRVYLGPCDECSRPDDRVDLYAREGAKRVTCRSCETVYWVDDRRANLLDRSANLYVTAEVATRALPSLLGYDLTYEVMQALVRRWGLRRYEPARGDAMARPRYRVGEIVDAVAARAAAAERRRNGGLTLAPRPPIDQLPPDVAELFTAVQRAAAARSAGSAESSAS